jgi:Mg-chelatase subunit ChlD
MNLTVLKRILILLFGPLVLLGGLYLWVVFRSPRPDSGRLVRTADRKIVWSGTSVQVQLHVNADQELPVRPNDNARKSQVIALVLDHSGSMGEGTESPLEAMKSAASFFARTTASTDQPLGVISFDDFASEVMALGSDGEASASAIQRIASGGGTDIAAGLLCKPLSRQKQIPNTRFA